MNYWDTSALLKLYVREPDSPYFTSLVSSAASPLLTSDLARIEIYSALSRKERAGELETGAAEVLFASFQTDSTRGRIVTLPIGSDVLGEAIRLTRQAHGKTPPLLIRSLDTLHVASALVSGANTVIATDSRLRQLAATAGLAQLP